MKKNKNNLIFKDSISQKNTNLRDLQKSKKIINQYLANIIKDLNNNINIFHTFSNKFKLNFNKKDLNKFNKFKTVVIIGMGGSILGAKAIYSFLKYKIKKEFFFLDNLDTKKILEINKNINVNKTLFIVISKSGNTIETLINLNLIKSKNKKSKNFIVITETKKSALSSFSKEFNILKINHRNFIGGRYSVLSEVGMLPAYFMNLNINKLRKNLLKNLDTKKRKYFTQIVPLISNIYSKKQLNTIVLLNYCPELNEFLFWYQQLLAESLGKKQKGLIPIISTAPKDNHSLLQLYLDGPKDKIFYIFNGTSNNKLRIKKNYFKNSFDFINNKEIKKILDAKKESFIKALKDKDISYREFNINNLDEETIGEMFAYFMIETILIAKSIGVDPFNQPAVEKVKILTKKYLY